MSTGEFGAAIEFIANPYLFKDAAEVKAAIDTRPLKLAVVLHRAKNDFPV